MKLAFFLPSLEGGGAERTSTLLANELAKQDFAVDLVLAQVKGPYLDQVSSRIRIVDLNSPRVLKALPGLRAYLQKEQPDILLSVLNHANVVAVWARKLARAKTRLVLTEHISILPSAAHARTIRARAMPLLIRQNYHQADAVVAVSQGVAQELVHNLGLPKSKVHVIYNPVINEELYRKAQEPPEHPWLAPGQPPVILAVGRLVPEKNFSLLLQAFALLRNRRNARLIILGEGPERPALEARVRQLGLEGLVDMPGFVHNPYSFMRHATVVALSSRWEALPTVLIEALALGKPVVSTDCPHGPREIITEPNLGWLVPLEDPFDLSRALEEALNEGDNGERSAFRKQFAKQRFSVESSVERYRELFSSITKLPSA